MARLIPRQAVEDIGLKPERDVARALVETLPEEVVVYHSYPWLRAERNDRARADMLREGEADFLVVDPHRGILILEVKGGTIEYDSRDHTWCRLLNGGRRRAIQDPFEQARKNGGPSRDSKPTPSS
ncbi:MAG: nuclease-related domain-containing protein [Acidobacteriota bacterium]